MATFYLDFEGGNDSNTGLSFAQRWKTITSGATAARTAPGDVIRIMKSPAPVALPGVTQFTKGSAVVTLESAVTANIDLCETSWTSANANVSTGTNGTRKQGTFAATVTPNTTFTTGLMAYKDIGTLDLSAYQKVSFWIRAQSAIAANSIRLDLCSDAVGTTPVHSIIIDTPFLAASWKAVTWDNGAALSTSIRSVALVALTDFGAVVILIDNIIATNDLHFNSLIGTSGSETSTIWYPIRSIEGTDVRMEVSQNAAVGTTMRGWSEATTTTTAYARSAIKIPASQTINESGTATALIEYSGGWDRTDMSTQDGLTILAGDTNLGSSTFLMTSRAYIIFRRIGVLWGSSYVTAGTQCRYYDIQLYGANANTGFAGDCYINNFTNVGGAVSVSLTASNNVVIDTATIYANTSGLSLAGHCPLAKNITSSNNGASGLATNGSAVIINAVLTDNGAQGFNNSGYAEVNGLITSGNPQGIINTGLLRLNNATINEATKFSSNNNLYSPVTASRYSTYKGFQYSGAAIRVQDVTTPVHGTATISYQHTPSTSSFTSLPLVQQLQPFAVNGSALVTFKIWVRRTNTNVEGRVRLMGWVTPGVDEDVTATSTASAGTWDELTVTCTPSAAGVVQIQLESYCIAGVAGDVYFGDATVSQA